MAIAPALGRTRPTGTPIPNALPQPCPPGPKGAGLFNNAGRGRLQRARRLLRPVQGPSLSSPVASARSGRGRPEPLSPTYYLPLASHHNRKVTIIVLICDICHFQQQARETIV